MAAEYYLKNYKKLDVVRRDYKIILMDLSVLNLSILLILYPAVLCAFDGDCDKCIADDGNGNVVDGDVIMYILGKRLKSRGVIDKSLSVKISDNIAKTNTGLSCRMFF